jgi:hypothetical protein
MASFRVIPIFQQRLTTILAKSNEHDLLATSPLVTVPNCFLVSSELRSKLLETANYLLLVVLWTSILQEQGLW